MPTVSTPRFLVIEVQCDKLPSRHEQDTQIPIYLALNGVPTPCKTHYERFGDVLAVHFLDFPVDYDIECVVMFKVADNG